jgi:hypothetical protein
MSKGRTPLINPEGKLYDLEEVVRRLAESRRTPSINPVGALGVSLLSFGLSLAATFFIPLFFILLLAFFGLGVSQSDIFVLEVSIYIIFEFVLFVIVGLSMSDISTKFHLLHALLVAGGHIGIWYFVGYFQDILFPYNYPTDIAPWVGYVSDASVIGGAILGSLLLVRLNRPITSKVKDVNHTDVK